MVYQILWTYRIHQSMNKTYSILLIYIYLRIYSKRKIARRIKNRLWKTTRQIMWFVRKIICRRWENSEKRVTLFLAKAILIEIDGVINTATMDQLDTEYTCHMNICMNKTKQAAIHICRVHTSIFSILCVQWNGEPYSRCLVMQSQKYRYI